MQRLQTDYIDLYQVHWPDEDTPIEETLYALDQLVRDGKVRYIGASNFPAWLFMKSLWVSDVQQLIRFESLQPRYSLLYRVAFERELEAACLDQGIGVIPFSPLAEGFLSGRFTRNNTAPETTRSDSPLIRKLLNDPESFGVLDEVGHIANTHNTTMAQVAIAWLLQRPVVTAPIIGPRTVTQLQDALGAINLKLADDEVDLLTQMTRRL